MSIRSSLAPLAILCAAGASLSLAACGGSASGSAATQAAASEQDLVKFTKCMREHGVNVSTPTGDAGQLRIGSSGGPANAHTLEAAQEACKRYQPSAGKENLTPAEKAARADAALKFAQCMRSHGVDVPNPQTSEGRISIHIEGKPGGLNPSGAAFQAAQTACQGLLPKPGGAKGGGLSTSSSPPGSGPSLGLQGR